MDMERVSAALREAAELDILPRFQRLAAGEVMEKRPGDVVTVADIEAERRLQRILKDIEPEAGFVGEEAAHADATLHDLLLGEDAFWLVDPVDGTANFAAGKTPFVVQVAFVRHGRTVAAWILDPVASEMRVAEEGSGAWADGTRLQAASAVPLAEMVGSVNARALGDDLRDRLRSRLDAFGTLVTHRCAGHDFSDMAKGNKHFSLYRRLWSWDHAPGVLLHREAGGHTARADGVTYRPGDRVEALLSAPDPDSWHAILDRLSRPED
ncbi:MAG: inositol monophosphatase [Alphaproteobacteria bacterium]